METPLIFGGITQVATTTAREQHYASVATLPQGGFVVVWRTYVADGSYMIAGQEFASDGSKLGPEFQINDAADANPHLPTVSALEEGGYVVSWRTSNQDGDSYGIASKMFSSLHGTTGNDIINGTETHDTIYAQAGNDQLIGGAGDDTLDGGAGSDTAVYAGNRADYSVVIEGDEITVTDTDTLDGDTGIDTLFNVEQFQFDDVVLDLSDFPSITDQSLFVDSSEGGVGQLRASGTTTETFGLSYALEEGPLNGAVVIDPITGSFSYTATSGYTGGDSFKYRVTDADGFVRIATMAVEVSDVSFTSGVEVQVNTTTAGIQNVPYVTSLVGGGHVVTWTSFDGNDDGIHGQRYDAAGATVGSEFQINTMTTDIQSYAKVASLSDGGFVVSWQSANQDGSSYGIYGQRFDASGVKAGSEFLINTHTAGDQKYTAVSGLDDGGFVVTWSSNGQDGSSWGTYGQKYDAAGIKVGTEFQVNVYETSAQYASEVASLPGGGFIIIWQSYNQTGNHYDIYGQRYDGAGAKIDTEFLVNTTVADYQNAAEVATFADGSFVIVWASDGQDGDDWGLYGQRFDGDGIRSGGEFQVATATEKEQHYASIETFTHGGFVIVWRTYVGDGSYSIAGQEFASDGSKLGSEFFVNDAADSNPHLPTVSALEGGGYVVSWRSSNQDGDSYGIASKLFSSLHGTTGNDIINGSGTHDTIYAQAGNDQLIGGSGNDTLDGGAGADTAVYAGIRSDYDIFMEEDQTFVRKISSGETDQLISVEIVRFADSDVSLSATDFPSITEQSLQLDSSEGGIGYLLGSDNATVTSSLVFALEDGPANGTVVVNADGSFSYTATSGYTGGDSFKYRVTDADGFVRIATMTVEVSDIEFTSDVETIVNTTITGTQSWPMVTPLLGGGYVVTWSSDDGNGKDIYGQQYDIVGNAVGIEFQINTTTVDIQDVPKIAGLSNGGFVVTWWSDGQDGSGWGVYGQRYSASGATVGSEFLVNSHTAGDQKYTSVSGLEDGGFVVTWGSVNQDSSGWGVYGQRFSESGAKAGGEFQVNTYTASSQYEPEVASFSGGGFVITWQSQNQDGDDYGIFGQRYDASGAAVGSEFQVNMTMAGHQIRTVVESFDDGSFVVIWESLEQDGSGYGLYGQRFDESANRVGGEFQVNTTTQNNQNYASVTGLSGGSFVIVWLSYHDDGSYSIVGQEFAADGSKLGSEFQINDAVDNKPHLPTVATLADGSYVVTWRSYLQDGDSYGIASKLFSSLHGTTGNDIINGSETHDVIYAQAGNDQLIGGTGNDTLDGGAGSDTAVFSGNRADYDIFMEEGLTFVRKISSGETDQLISVEIVRFADSDVSLSATDFPSITEQSLQLDNWTCPVLVPHPYLV